MMNMKVKKIIASLRDAQAVPELLDAEGVTFRPIDNVNWEAWPYKPQAEFRMAHTGDTLLLHFRVTEGSVRARYGEDNGSVWTDSCVEFFSIPGGDDIYYNLECNCIGTVLLGAGQGRKGREHAPAEALDKVMRWASLGRDPFEEQVGERTWEVALTVPAATFFKHRLTSFDGLTVRANFYKCGDELRTPHFLSWAPIRTEQPDFHRPEFFGTLELE